MYDSFQVVYETTSAAGLLLRMQVDCNGCMLLDSALSEQADVRISKTMIVPGGRLSIGYSRFLFLFSMKKDRG